MYLPVDFVWEIITSCLSVSNRQLTTSKSVKYKSYDFHNTMQIITRCLLHHILSLIAYTFPVNRDFVFIIIVQFVMSAHIRMRLGLLIVSVLHYTISLSSLCKLIWGHWTYIVSVRYFLSSMWVRLSIFSQLSIIKSMGLCVFSLSISLGEMERIHFVLLLSSNRKYELISIV